MAMSRASSSAGEKMEKSNQSFLAWQRYLFIAAAAVIIVLLILIISLRFRFCILAIILLFSFMAEEKK